MLWQAQTGTSLRLCIPHFQYSHGTAGEILIISIPLSESRVIFTIYCAGTSAPDTYYYGTDFSSCMSTGTAFLDKGAKGK